MIMPVVSDYPTVKSEQDHNAEAVNDHARRLSRAALLGAHWGKFFPWMKHIPSW
jgi:hypothetical protein